MLQFQNFLQQVSFNQLPTFPPKFPGLPLAPWTEQDVQKYEEYQKNRNIENERFRELSLPPSPVKSPLNKLLSTIEALYRRKHINLEERNLALFFMFKNEDTRQWNQMDEDELVEAIKSIKGEVYSLSCMTASVPSTSPIIEKAEAYLPEYLKGLHCSHRADGNSIFSAAAKVISGH